MPVRAARPPAPRGLFEPPARPWPSRLAAALLIALARAYRLLVSPILGPSCRYLPTCSEYAIEAVERHGPWRGAGLALARVCRCHPWGGDGYDPVPPTAAPAAAAPAPRRTDRTGAR